MYNDELYHYGRKGMKWYQSVYGSTKRGVSNASRAAFAPEINTKKGPRSKAQIVAEESGNIIKSGETGAKAISTIQKKKITEHQSSRQNRQIRQMSDEELKTRIKRLEMEKKYRQLTTRDVKTGADKASEILSILGQTAMVAGGLASTAATIYMLKDS